MSELQAPQKKDSPGAGLAIAQSVIAQSVFFVGLVYLFGWSYQNAYYKYFGLSAEFLGIAAVDVMISGGSVLVLVLLAIAMAINFFLQTHYFYRDGKVRHARIMSLILGIGLTAIIVAVLGVMVFVEEDYIYKTLVIVVLYALMLALIPLYFGFSRAAGVISERIANYVREKSYVIMALYGILAFTLILAAGIGIGGVRAAQSVDDRSKLPSVVIYSKEDLRIERAGVKKSALVESSDSRYSYKYTGLLLLAKKSDRLYLLEQAKPKSGVLVIPDDDSIRLDIMGRD